MNYYAIESLICSTEGFTCDHCDLKEVLAISELMLKYFTTATLNRFPRSITILKAVEVKNDLVCALDLPDSSDPMYYTRNFIEERLQAFSKEGINALSMASATLARNDAKDTRENEVNDFHLPAWEREELALMVLRKHDLHFDYHCELQNCGNQCIFIREKCSNGDCSVIYSKKWFAEHDSVCPYKKVDCERRCGVLIERMNMEKHMTTTCSLMPVTCHFAEFGCKEGTLSYYFIMA